MNDIVWPRRVWKRTESGRWFSREATKEDLERRADVENRIFNDEKQTLKITNSDHE